ncbi:MAG TPA: MFS transporter [Dehalococcoidia bacterium]|nr:MFS transporter [Dehalococcoidia bacterium]
MTSHLDDIGGDPPTSVPPVPDRSRTSVFVIAAAVCATSMSYNLWYPFLPLYVLELGATSDANAVFWMSIALTAQGIGRLASSAVWGVLSDRLGRKVMMLRALFLGTFTFGVAAVAQAPWHLAIALGCQGFFSGFVPASVALVSVIVPDSRLNRSLSIVTGGQYLGTTIGPAVGAGLALLLSYRASIAVAAIVPFIAGIAILLMVPRDPVAARRTATEPPLEPFRMSGQFKLAIGALFAVYCMNELIRLATPIALKGLKGSDDVAGEAGLAFTLAGLVSAISVLFLAPRVFRGTPSGPPFALICSLGCVGFLLVAFANGVPVYILGFLTIFLVVSAMVPALNTLIAANVRRSRRGTAFGVAGTVQALAFGVGPLAGAFFAAVSLDAGFFTVALLFLAVGFVLFTWVREPQPL